MTDPHDQHDNSASPPIESTVPRVIVVPSTVVIRPNMRNCVNDVDAAKYLDCSTKHLQNMRRDGRGPTYEKIAGRVWYPMKALEEYVEACTREGHR